MPELSRSINQTYCASGLASTVCSSTTVSKSAPTITGSVANRLTKPGLRCIQSRLARSSASRLIKAMPISAKVQYWKANTFLLSIANLTQKVYTTVPTCYTQSAQQAQLGRVDCRAPHLEGTLPLAHFGTIAFSNLPSDH